MLKGLGRYLWTSFKRYMRNERGTWGAIGLTAGGAALGAGANMLRKPGETITDPYGALNPEQKKLMQSLGPNIQQWSTEGTTPYSGQYSAPMTQGEQDIISQNSRMSALMNTGSMNSLLSGEWTPEWENMYQQSIYKPLTKQYKEDIAPQIEEQYAGSGGYWGGARAGAVGKGYRDLQDTLSAKRAELGLEAFKSPLSAYPVAQAWQQASADIQAKPRLIDNYNLNQEYEEWKRTQPTEYLDAAINFLNINSVTQEYKPSEGTFASDFLGTLGGAATSYGLGQLGGLMQGGSSSGGGGGGISLSGTNDDELMNLYNSIRRGG